MPWQHNQVTHQERRNVTSNETSDDTSTHVIDYQVQYISSIKNVGDSATAALKSTNSSWISRSYAEKSIIILDLGVNKRVTRITYWTDPVYIHVSYPMLNSVHLASVVSVFGSKSENYRESKYKELGSARFWDEKVPNAPSDTHIFCESHVRWVLFKLGPCVANERNTENRVGIRTIVIHGYEETHSPPSPDQDNNRKRRVRFNGDDSESDNDEYHSHSEEEDICESCGHTRRRKTDLLCENCGERLPTLI